MARHRGYLQEPAAAAAISILSAIACLYSRLSNAMTYLAAAYNRGDLRALHYVTEPRAFSRLMSMRSDALNLKLKYCTANPRGDYTCYFRHDFPASEHKSGHGQAVFIAAPALNPGWYMYQFQSCD